MGVTTMTIGRRSAAISAISLRGASSQSEEAQDATHQRDAYPQDYKEQDEGQYDEKKSEYSHVCFLCFGN